jgi:hypothetical protein
VPIHTLSSPPNVSQPASLVGAIILYSIDTQTTQFHALTAFPDFGVLCCALLAGDRTTSGLLVYAQSCTSHCPITLDFHVLVIVIIVER